MNESLLLGHLPQAEKHVEDAQERVAQQQALVKRLERDGHDIRTATVLLREFEHSLELHRSGLARVREELGIKGP